MSEFSGRFEADEALIKAEETLRSSFVGQFEAMVLRNEVLTRKFKQIMLKTKKRVSVLFELLKLGSWSFS